MGWDNLKAGLHQPNSIRKAKEMDKDVQTRTFGQNDKPIEPKFSVNDIGNQAKTFGQSSKLSLLDNDRGARQDSVPGMRTIPEQKSSDPQDPDNDPVRGVQIDPDIIIKLSALKKFRQQSKEKPAKKAGRSSKDLDDLEVQR